MCFVNLLNMFGDDANPCFLLEFISICPLYKLVCNNKCCIVQYQTRL